MINWFIFRQNWQIKLRKRFVLLFLSSFLTIVLLINNNVILNAQTKPEIRGVWLTTNDTDTLLDHFKLEKAINQLTSVNFNTLYPVVWNSGYVFYPSKVAENAGIQAFAHKGLQGQDPLQDLIIESHKRNLLVIPWFEFGFMTPPSSELAFNHPEWLTQKLDGNQTYVGVAGEVVWLNPFLPEVQQFITNLVLEVVTYYDIDGIQFDDHFSLPKEFGYDSYTVNLYEEETEEKVPNNPDEANWVSWRANKITEFVRKLNQTIKAQKPQIIFSVSPNPYHTAYNNHLQDWLTWVREDLIDELIVQIYRPNLQSFYKEIIRPEIQEAKQKIPTGVGVLSGLRNRKVQMDFIEDKVLAARDNGLGVAFFFYDSLWNYAPESPQERLAKFFKLFPFTATRTVKLDNKPLIIDDLDLIIDN